MLCTVSLILSMVSGLRQVAQTRLSSYGQARSGSLQMGIAQVLIRDYVV